jgi:hypothetical protein
MSENIILLDTLNYKKSQNNHHFTNHQSTGYFVFPKSMFQKIANDRFPFTLFLVYHLIGYLLFFKNYKNRQ